MIELTPNGAVMLYLFVTVIVILGIWITQHYRLRHKTILSNDQTLHVCEYCHFAYLDHATKKVSQCPQCGCYNSKP